MTKIALTGNVKASPPETWRTNVNIGLMVTCMFVKCISWLTWSVYSVLPRHSHTGKQLSMCHLNALSDKTQTVWRVVPTRRTWTHRSRKTDFWTWEVGSSEESHSQTVKRWRFGVSIWQPANETKHIELSRGLTGKVNNTDRSCCNADVSWMSLAADEVQPPWQRHLSMVVVSPTKPPQEWPEAHDKELVWQRMTSMDWTCLRLLTDPQSDGDLGNLEARLSSSQNSWLPRNVTVLSLVSSGSGAHMRIC